MKTRNTQLQPSEKLAPFVDRYRDEAPLVSTSEVRATLEHSDQLPNRPPTTIRKTIMTLAGLSAIALVLYQIFSGTPDPGKNAQRTEIRTQAAKIGTHTLVEHRNPTGSALNSSEPRKGAASMESMSVESKDRPAYAAPGDQMYADLTAEQLARLGIVVVDDTAILYTRNRLGTVSSTKLSTDQIAGSESARPIKGAIPTSLLPLIMTEADGQTAAFYHEDAGGSHWGITGDDVKKREWIRKYFDGPAKPGLRVLRFRHFSYDSRTDGAPPVHWDSVVVIIGKDVPELPFANGSIPKELPDSLAPALRSLSEYYLGKGALPRTKWPNNFWVRADTVTLSDLLRQYDEEVNSKDKVYIRKTLSRLNELIPVIVRTKPGTGKPSNNDYIFWYEPSEELFAALPSAQAALFRRPATPTHCLTAPNAVSKDATITYCASEAQQVEAVVQDLAGHIIRIVLVDAHAGDNTLVIPTEVLPAGMYIVTIRMKDGSQQSRRIWSENEHPEPLPIGGATNVPSATVTDIPVDTQAHRVIITFPRNFSASQVERYVTNQPDRASFENLDIDSLLSRQTSLSSKTKEDVRTSMLKVQKALKKVHPRLSTNANYFDSLAHLKSTPLGVQYIELTHESELRLGVESMDALVRFYTSTGKDTYTGIGVMRTWGVQVLQFTREEIAHEVPPLTPSLVTDGIGRKRLSVNGAPNDSAINSLVPILFRATTEDTLGARDLIFWYQPSAEFLAALPDSIRAIVTGTIHSAVHAQLPGALRTVRTYPNPSHGEFALDLTLDAPRKLSVVVRNLLGQERARTMLDVPEGASTQKLSFTSLEEGIYLLELTSDAGETRFERIVVER